MLAALSTDFLCWLLRLHTGQTDCCQLWFVKTSTYFSPSGILKITWLQGKEHRRQRRELAETRQGGHCGHTEGQMQGMASESLTHLELKYHKHNYILQLFLLVSERGRGSLFKIFCNQPHSLSEQGAHMVQLFPAVSTSPS